MANEIYIIKETEGEKEITRLHTPEALAKYIISDLWSNERFHDHPSFLMHEEFKEAIEQEAFYDRVSEDFSVSGNKLLMGAANSTALSYRQKALAIAADIIMDKVSRGEDFYIDNEKKAIVRVYF